MAPPQMNSILGSYNPGRDVLDHQDMGITKNRKTSSTGGGRAWNEEEENYLIQTRLQKMPYKHIAAHLKKTELACRLHYHQLAHGTNRRRRAMSCSSSASDYSSMMHASLRSSPRGYQSRSISPIGHGQQTHGVMMGAQIPLPSMGMQVGGSSLPTILPKPQTMMPYTIPSQRLPTPPTYDHQQNNTMGMSSQLRLDCSGMSPPSMATHTPSHVELSRLHSVYDAHRNAFWAAIANDYGPTASPATLESAWKTGACCPQNMVSPGNNVLGSSYQRASYENMMDKTRISSILV